MKHTQNLYPNVEVFYSTPTRYFEAVEEYYNNLGQNPPVRSSNDFLPYADDSKSYWSGLYTSWPNFKEAIRETSKTYMSSNHQLALSAISETTFLLPSSFSQDKIKEAIAMTQHHEVVTGTILHDVRNDFLDYLFTGISESDNRYSDALNEALQSRVKF